MLSKFSWSFGKVKFLALAIGILCLLFVGRYARREQATSLMSIVHAKSEPTLDHTNMASSPKLSTSPSYTYNWHAETVAKSQDFVLNSSSFKLDRNNQPHFVYGGSDLYYSWAEGTVWRRQIIDSSLGEKAIEANAVLSLDANNTPHVLYYDFWQEALKYAYQDGGNWFTETIEATAKPHSMAIDSNDVPHVIYLSEATGTARYGYRTESGWITENVPDSNGIEGRITLALDGQDRLHIVLTALSEGSRRIQYAHKSTGNWAVEELIVLSPSDTIVVSLAIDSHDSPHILIQNDQGPIWGLEVYYAYQNVNGWVVEPVAVEGALLVTGISLDNQDRLHLVLQFQSSTQYAIRNGVNQWNYTAISHIDAYTTSTLLLQLDGNDQPHIGYLATPNPEAHYSYLNYMYKMNGLWQTKTVDASGVSIAGPEIAIDDHDALHIAFGAAGKVQYGRWLGGQWIIETVDTNSGSIGPIKLVVDADNIPHLLYYDFGDNALVYAHQSPSGWLIEEIETGFAQFIDLPYSLAIDSEGLPAIIYLNPTEKSFTYQLYFARYVDNSLDSELINNEASEYISEIILDSQDKPYISFSTSPSWPASNHLYFGWRTEQGNWNFDVIHDTVYQSVVLRLDGMDTPHLVYGYTISDTEIGFEYAYKEADGWHFETIFTASGQNFYGSLQMLLDSQHQPHISASYYDFAKYAYREGSNWTVETPIDDEYSLYNDFALDDQDIPHLIYAFPLNTYRYYYQENNMWVEETIDGELGYRDMSLTKSGLPIFITTSGDHVNILSRRLSSASTILTDEGGVLATPDGQTALSFPANVFSDTVHITMTLSEPPIRQGNLWGIGYQVVVTAVTTNTNQPAQLLPGQTYTMTVNYQHYPPAIEESLAFYHWLEPAWTQAKSSTQNMPNNILQTTPNSFGRWAILGATHQVYFPVVSHYPARD